ncbi:MAG: GNAT family N-acetyltransferase, partial [Anaerolineae bacterium]|nr:GNAT family N-acetyltransferase [Anaerolineae bacterium]
ERDLDRRFTVRPASLADAQAATDLVNTCAREVLGHDTMDVTFLENDWASPYCNPETNLRLVFDGDRLVGYAGAWTEPPAVTVYGWIHVHPSYRGQGIGVYLATWQKDLVALAATSVAPEDARIVIQLEKSSLDDYARELLLAQGYRVVRHGFRMLIELAAEPPEPVLPEGIVLSTFDRARHLPDLVRAEQEIFKDHWGFVQLDFEQDLTAWEHSLDNDTHHNAELWFLAVERDRLHDAAGDVIAGVCLCTDFMPEDPDMAYVGSLGVQRKWRRQGLGLAMLHHAFGVFRRRGKKRVTLHVDAESLTGATRLYEKAGMHVEQKNVFYEYVVREGRDLSTQALGDKG